MKERPILFSAPMVRALLDGAKTQTRRALKTLPIDILPFEGEHAGKQWVGLEQREPEPRGRVFRCRYGFPGDRLWVRETWAHYQTVNHIRRPSGAAFSEVSDGLAGYRADGHDTIEDFREHVRLMSGCDLEAIEINGNRWRPSIHMPRWASRITLEITGVRVERLQEISYEDACAEGCKIPDCRRENVAYGETWDETSRRLRWPQRDFESVWTHINGDDSWAANPWVWVIEFKRLTP